AEVDRDPIGLLEQVEHRRNLSTVLAAIVIRLTWSFLRTEYRSAIAFWLIPATRWTLRIERATSMGLLGVLPSASSQAACTASASVPENITHRTWMPLLSPCTSLRACHLRRPSWIG